MDYSYIAPDAILGEYLQLLFFGFFGLSTLFLIALFALSYKYKIIIPLLSYMGASSIPFCFGIASKYFVVTKTCVSSQQCDGMSIIALFMYFFVNGLLALSFWNLRSKQERAAAVAPSRAA
ncbi:MAG: hypothetical protein AABZ31_14770 [Bdellovibrionota bacterium]